MKQRVNDLVSRLRTEEIMYQIAKGGGGKYGGPTPAIARLGIGPYQWDTECLSGDVMGGNATSFPITIFKIVMRHSHLIHDEVIYGILTG
jgi:beta-glucosidase